MSKPDPHVRKFVSLIREATGNVVPRARYRFVEELAERRARTLRLPSAAIYVNRLAGGQLPEEWHQLIPLITIKESYFFRAPQQFRMLSETLLPRLVRARSSDRVLRVWSAACARGEEPGTLAMVLAESHLLGNWEWEILATDVDEDAVETAKRGLYGERAVAQVPPYLLSRYFSRRGKLYELSATLRSRIRYRVANLTRAKSNLDEGPFDLLFLRNVLIYFPRPLQRRVVGEAAERMAPHGYLFLGASETLWQIYDDLAPLDLDVCFCYRHRPPGEPVKPPPRPVRPPSPPPEPAPPPPIEEPDEPEPLPEPSEPEEDEVAFETAELAEPVEEEPPSTPPCGVQERLVEAARELAGNELGAASAILEEIMESDPSEPAAHALEGFLYDLRGEEEEAMSSYRAALYLDPSLFQVRLLLADTLLRMGSRKRAINQYREVLSSLESGRERELVTLEDLPLPNRVRAERRCRQVLRRS